MLRIVSGDLRGWKFKIMVSHLSPNLINTKDDRFVTPENVGSN